MTSLLGFARKGKNMQTLTHTTVAFLDKGIEHTCYQAKIVPLEIIPNENPWLLSQDYSFVPQELKTVFDQNQLLVTSTTPKSPFFLLMYVPKDNPKMARMGVLLYQSDQILKPVLVKIEGYDYIVELKGAGSPVGKFPDCHYRQQAGTTKLHVRLTGGMPVESALKEFQQLESIRKIQSKIPTGKQIRALGVSQFIMQLPQQNIHLGTLMRLAPSSIRHSFYNHPIFDRMINKSQAFFSKNMGFEVAKFLELPEPAIHNNIGWNNFVYVDHKTYILSDYEELDTIASGQCNLDLFHHVYSAFFLFYPFRFLWKKSFFEGVKEFSGKASSCLVDEHQSMFEFNRHVFSSFGKRLFEQLCASSQKNYSHVLENINAVRLHVSPAYFKLSPYQFSKKHLLDSFQKQRAIVEIFIAYSQKHSYQYLNDQLELREKTHLLYKQIHSISSDIATCLFSSSKALPIGDYTMKDTWNTQFLRPAQHLLDLKERLDLIDAILYDLNTYIQTKKLLVRQDYVTELFLLRNSLHFLDLPLLLFPFIGFLSVYFANEKSVLLGAQKHHQTLTPKHNKILSHSLKVLEKRIVQLNQNPALFYRALKVSDSTFIALLKLPYES